MNEAVTQDALVAQLERERAALHDLLPRFSDEQWRSTTRDDGWTVHDIAIHTADASYGLALLALGEAKPTLPVNPETGWMDPTDYNAQRRQKNADLPREKVMSRMQGAFDAAQRAITASGNLAAPGPYGEAHTQGQWLQNMVDHIASHRQELGALL